jgi:hypothetical protein
MKAGALDGDAQTLKHRSCYIHICTPSLQCGGELISNMVAEIDFEEGRSF